MARAIEQLASGLTIGHAALGRRGEARGSVAQQVHDGDTVTVEAMGNFGVRLLGVDAPEVSFTPPGRRGFVELSDPVWERFLTDPFADGLPPLSGPIDPELKADLARRCGPGTGTNHARLAEGAHRALEGLVSADLAELGKAPEDFRFFLAFAHEVMDRYGRLLGYLNRDQRGAANRPPSYNERMLREGWVIPYFIWPNINPFRRQGSLLEAVPRPGEAAHLAESEPALRRAREWARQAQADGVGVYDKGDPLRLFPFELRFLAQRRTPDRWLIDLDRSDETLVPPQRYFTVRPESRLFVSAEYVPLFESAGWRRAS